MGLDAAILLWIQDTLRTPVLDGFMSRFTHLGDHGFLWIVIGLILLIIPKTRKVGLMAAVALILMLVINNVLIKQIVDRPRPYTQIPDLKLIVAEAKDASFPSGHACSAFAAATVCFRNLPKIIGIAAICLAFLISFSRVYVGIHYPTDVLAGVILGIIIGIAAGKLVGWADKKGWLKSLPLGLKN